MLTDITLEHVCGDATPALSQLILNNSHTLQHISFRFCSTSAAIILAKAVQKCPHLTNFIVTKFQFSLETISELAQLVRANPQLNTLVLESAEIHHIDRTLLIINYRKDNEWDWSLFNGKCQSWSEFFALSPECTVFSFRHAAIY